MYAMIKENIREDTDLKFKEDDRTVNTIEMHCVGW